VSELLSMKGLSVELKYFCSKKGIIKLREKTSRSTSIMKLAHVTLSGAKILFLMTGTMMMFSMQPNIVSVSLQQPKPKSFEAWCNQKESVPAATRNTIDSLLEKAGTKNCKSADRQLKTFTGLEFYGEQISDVEPLAGLTNLRTLTFSGNQISDVKPLMGLTNLTNLYLDANQISNVKPLARLTNLGFLNLNRNQISDVKPLANLTNLARLNLNRNQIIDVRPLAGLTNLTDLSLMSNQISDVKPLVGLTNLIRLNLFDNPIAVKVCPIKPESICNF
jgi:internalin A